VQVGSRNSYYALASLFKEKAPVEGTPSSAVSGFAAFSNDAFNFFSKYKFSYFPFSVRFLHIIFSFGTMLFQRLEKGHFQRLKSLCSELEGIPLDFYRLRTVDPEFIWERLSSF
jgi:hypothetical protein